MKLLAVEELELKDRERHLIAITDSIFKAEELIKEYYGDYEEISKNDIREGPYEYTKTLNVRDHENCIYTIEISLTWFHLNKL